jgi:hypothetical protein
MSNGISSCLRKEDGDEIQRLFEQMSSGIDSKKLKEINQSETLQKVKNLVRISIVKKSKKTGNLWINLYQEMVDILKSFIKSERTGNWKLHLKTTVKMLPYFESAGHNNLSIYETFMPGFHVIRRTDKFWGGLSTDLVFEQKLMRSMKASGKSITNFNF